MRIEFNVKETSDILDETPCNVYNCSLYGAPLRLHVITQDDNYNHFTVIHG